MQVRKNQVPGGAISKYGIIKYDCARVENASTVRNNEASIDRWPKHRWIALRNRHYKTPKKTCELKK